MYLIGWKRSDEHRHLVNHVEGYSARLVGLCEQDFDLAMGPPETLETLEERYMSRLCPECKALARESDES